ncbi:hypothetical protein RQP53_22905 [Paucibacter sp. APW11]|uniref:Big-1 domain-containing protein n=1 Tax=Roseateles aquae TaxID=3077235 RepID=A0ABU3PHX0_9BURK|nr:hypothetical protein [Paucibacter sp. APW11]MDT9002147.1 hypothetical protein [Paucibacter sp. APW11]
MKTILQAGGRWLLACGASLSLLLSACGGGGSAGTPVLGGGGGTTPSTLTDLAIVADKTSIPNTGSDVVNLTITALAQGNAALIGTEVPVTVEVDAGAIVIPAAKTTDKASGQLLAKVSLVDRTSRTINVTATSGSISKKFSFNVVDAVNGSKVADLAVVLSKATMANNGSEQLTATVTSLDANRSAIGGVPVSLRIVDVGDAFVQADGGATSTDAASGQLNAKVSLGNNHTNRRVALTVSSGTVTRSVSFDVVDAATGSVGVASDLSLTLNKLTVGNSGLDTVDVVVTAVDANRNAAAGVEVIFAVDNNAVLVPSAKATDAKGEIKATVSIGSDRSNRLVTVTATSKTLKRTAAFSVNGAKLQATLQPGTLNAGDAGTVEYTLTDINGNPMPNFAITATGPSGLGGAGTTDSSGKWVYSYVAAGSGPTSIIAAAGGIGVASTVQINAAVPVAVGTIQSATFTATPNVVAVNALGKSDNRSEMRLLFRGANNAPVANVRARIGFGANATSTDATISSGADKIVYSDLNGVAAFSVVAGQRSSPTQQLKVFACYQIDDSVEQIASCPSNRLLSVSLTIVEQPVSVSIGTNGLIGEGATGLTYTQDYTVLVVDAAGNPKSNVQISPVIDLLQYRKGDWSFDTVNKIWVQSVQIRCANEDALIGGYRNGTIEAGEDINGSGQLDPRKSDVSIYMVGSTKTDASGLATVRIEFLKSVASWVEFSIQASASGVISPPAWFGRMPLAGAPNTLFGPERWLPVPLSVIKSEATPPFALSPYGISNSCSSPN